MNLDGKWDCQNPKCKSYHEIYRRPYQDHAESPKCPRCKKGLRLLRVIRGMDPAVKALLRARKEQQS